MYWTADFNVFNVFSSHKPSIHNQNLDFCRLPSILRTTTRCAVAPSARRSSVAAWVCWGSASWVPTTWRRASSSCSWTCTRTHRSLTRCCGLASSGTSRQVSHADYGKCCVSIHLSILVHRSTEYTCIYHNISFKCTVSKLLSVKMSQFTSIYKMYAAKTNSLYCRHFMYMYVNKNGIGKLVNSFITSSEMSLSQKAYHTHLRFHKM